MYRLEFIGAKIEKASCFGDLLPAQVINVNSLLHLRFCRSVFVESGTAWYFVFCIVVKRFFKDKC